MIATRLMFCSAALLGTGLMVLPACKTDTPGVKSNYYSQWTTVNASTEKATETAQSVLEELKLKKVESKATAIDGEAMGYTADGTKVSVGVRKVNDETSEVSVYAGMGDPTLGKEILSRMMDDLNKAD